METKNNETNFQGLTREDLVSILGGSNVMNYAEVKVDDKTNADTLQQKQQEALACDAIG